METYFKNPIEGYFKIEQFDKYGNLIDSFEDKNMIMQSSKTIMRDAMRGESYTHPNLASYPSQLHINTLVLGTEGHSGDNLLSPKTFDYTKTDLFSVESANGKTYPITFNPTLSSNIVLDEGYDGDLPNSRATTTEVTITKGSDSDNRYIEYTFIIPIDNANDGGGAIAYTEAALYANLNQNIPGLSNNPGDSLVINNQGTIFAMRTFPAKIKDTETSLRIIWRIIF